MKRAIFLASILLIFSLSSAQSNLVSNPSFEGNIIQNDFPKKGEVLSTNSPTDWYDFKNGRLSAWFVDSTWVQQNQNQIDPQFQNGFFFDGLCENHANPFEPTFTQGLDTLSPMLPDDGHFYVGFDANAGFAPGAEGIQQRLNGGCDINDGDYLLTFKVARAFTGGRSASNVRFNAHFSTLYNRRDWKIEDWLLTPNLVPGVWYPRSKFFSLDAYDLDNQELNWLVLSGRTYPDNTECGGYVFLDDVKLRRPCDEVQICFPASGQICPLIQTPNSPDDLLIISNISNANSLRLEILNLQGASVYTTTFANPNGMPIFSLSRATLPAGIASAQYIYSVTLGNLCGNVIKKGLFNLIGDTAVYTNHTIWTDSTSNWSPVPVPCCLSSLVLENMQIVGDVSYIVRDNITVQNGVSVAAGSHVTLQAGQVIELTNVEFDGTNSSVEILEVPCPNRLSCDGGSGGIATLNAGVIEVPDNNSIEDLHQEQISTELGTAANEIQKDVQTNQGLPTLSAFPNPFTDQLTVSFSLEAESQVNLQILDLQMRPVRTLLTNSTTNKGGHEIAADLKELPAGIYLIQMEVNGERMHQGIVKQ